MFGNSRLRSSVVVIEAQLNPFPKEACGKPAEKLLASRHDRVRFAPDMTKVAILPESADTGQITYRAIAGRRQSWGKTAGEALDVLTASLPEEDAGTLVIVQHHRPDQFFTAAQQARLNELMARWRALRDAGGALPPTCEKAATVTQRSVPR